VHCLGIARNADDAAVALVGALHKASPADG